MFMCPFHRSLDLNLTVYCSPVGDTYFFQSLSDINSFELKKKTKKNNHTNKYKILKK